jgi:hypothetical protein
MLDTIACPKVSFLCRHSSHSPSPGAKPKPGETGPLGPVQLLLTWSPDVAKVSCTAALSLSRVLWGPLSGLAELNNYTITLGLLLSHGR